MRRLVAWWKRRKAERIWNDRVAAAFLVEWGSYRIGGWLPAYYQQGEKPRYRYWWPEAGA